MIIFTVCSVSEVMLYFVIIIILFFFAFFTSLISPVFNTGGVSYTLPPPSHGQPPGQENQKTPHRRVHMGRQHEQQWPKERRRPSPCLSPRRQKTQTAQASLLLDAASLYNNIHTVSNEYLMVISVYPQSIDILVELLYIGRATKSPVDPCDNKSSPPPPTSRRKPTMLRPDPAYTHTSGTGRGRNFSEFFSCHRSLSSRDARHSINRNINNWRP